MIHSLPEALTGHPLAVVDIEGNGGQRPEIVEIAVLQVDVPEVVRVGAMRTWLVRPTQPITGYVSAKVHGITNHEVRNCPSWAEVSADVQQYLQGRTLVAHNATVEQRVLATHLPDWHPPCVLDTQRLARRVWPDLDGHGLDALIDYGGLDDSDIPGGQRRHRAGYDTWCTWQLLHTLLEQSGLTWPQLLDAAALPGSTTPEGGLW